jgi:hypothetical protein
MTAGLAAVAKKKSSLVELGCSTSTYFKRTITSLALAVFASKEQQYQQK